MIIDLSDAVLGRKMIYNAMVVEYVEGKHLGPCGVAGS
jgi:hypothetical protein